jgi:carotenoid 1,2-hydratase
VALNVALYGRRRNLWAMTERGRGALGADATTLAIGPSGVSWEGDRLVVTIREQSSPLPLMGRPEPLTGTVTLRPRALFHQRYPIDGAGHHDWCPIAPLADVAVAFSAPAIRWSGHGYCDTNAGTRLLAADFPLWHWSRAEHRGDAVVFYDTARADGSAGALALRFRPDGSTQPFAPPPPAVLSRSGWGIRRATRCDAGQRARVLRTVEDTPFYARSIVATQLDGAPTTLMHETLNGRRLLSPIVQRMLPYRMPRVA